MKDLIWSWVWFQLRESSRGFVYLWWHWFPLSFLISSFHVQRVEKSNLNDDNNNNNNPFTSNKLFYSIIEFDSILLVSHTVRSFKTHRRTLRDSKCFLCEKKIRGHIFPQWDSGVIAEKLIETGMKLKKNKRQKEERNCGIVHKCVSS